MNPDGSELFGYFLTKLINLMTLNLDLRFLIINK